MARAARVRRKPDTVEKSAVSWRVRAAACLPQSQPISNPLLGEEAAGTVALFDTDAVAEFDLLDVLRKAATATAALLILPADVVKMNTALLELCEFTAYAIEGADRLVVANYQLPDAPWLTKADLGLSPGDAGHAQPEQGALLAIATEKPVIVPNAKLITKTADVIKESDERYVLGVVLEPDEVDSQGDTIAAAEIRQAAHKYMQDYGNVGLQHQTFVNGKVKILESYICPVDCVIGGQPVKAGTWLMAFRVLDDSIWTAVKEGLLTGLSIGGLGTRVAA
jgi:hypothetical protein